MSVQDRQEMFHMHDDLQILLDRRENDRTRAAGELAYMMKQWKSEHERDKRRLAQRITPT